MSGKKPFSINTPRGRVITVTGEDGSVTVKLEWNVIHRLIETS